MLNRLAQSFLTFILAAGFIIAANPVQSLATEAACTRSQSLAEAIAPFAKGELKAFVPEKQPQSLRTLSFDDKDGNPTTLEKWQGRVVLLNLWATWCAPCRKEMPALEKLQQTLGGETFEVVPVSLDRGGNIKPKAFYEKIGIKLLPLYTDDSRKIFSELQGRGLLFGLPTSILIDTEGCTIGTLKGPAEWDSDDAIELIRSALKATSS